MATPYYVVGVLLLALVVSGQEVVEDKKEEAKLAFMNGLQNISPMIGSIGKSEFMCQYCENVVSLLKNITMNPQTLDGIEKILESVCQWAPFALHAECIDVVKALPEMIKECAQTYLDPVTACMMVCAKPVMIDSEPKDIPEVIDIVNLIQAMTPKKPVNDD